MSTRSCMDDAIYCPDVKCTKCDKPYTTWVWKDRLLFTCPDCNELGFSVDNMDINKSKLPKRSFFMVLEWPCETDPDPNCIRERKMLFIENYSELDFLQEVEVDEFGISYENFTMAQKAVGKAYDKIIERICS